MGAISAANTDTDARLLVAGAALIAEHGFDAVSTRAINRHAGVNNAALHYHFGTKLGLARAIAEKGMDAMYEARKPLLEEAERKECPTARDIAVAWAAPLIDLALNPDLEPRHWLRFAARIGESRDLAVYSNEVFAPERERYEKLLGRLLPDVPSPVRQFRFFLMRRTNQDAVAAWAGKDIRSTGLDDLDAKGFVDALYDVLAGTLLAVDDPNGRRRPSPRRTRRPK
jgi:AcrR family transcriptional regulator